MVYLLSTAVSAAAIILHFYGSLVPGNIYLKNAVGDLRRQITHCALSKDPQKDSFTDPLLGLFGPSIVQCPFPTCAPERPRDIDTRFLFKSHSIEGEKFIPADQLITENDTLAFESIEEYIQSDTIWILVQGWTESFRFSPEINETIATMNRAGADVILVDWLHGATDIYVATVNAQVVGAQIGFLIDSLDILEQVECIGFSVGANVCGFAGQWLKKKRQLMIPRCTGIDPSGAFIQGCPNDYYLTKDDCEVVTVIHTTQLGAPQTGGGTDINQGHCDYWINYRHHQSGCQPHDTLFSALERSTNLSLTRTDKLLIESLNIFSCDHRAALRYFTKQIESEPESSFNFRECSDRQESSYCYGESESESNSSEFIHPMPPFDTCTADDSKTFCLCIK